MMTRGDEIDTPPGGSQAGSIVRLTLQDGTRIQLPVDEIAYVEPIAGGTLIRRSAGEPLKAVQDVRTVEVRVRAALAAGARDNEQAAEDIPVPADPARGEIGAADTPSTTEPRSLSHRAKRLLHGRVSLRTLVIARASGRPRTGRE